jgi:hypothetical protein
MAVGLVLAVLVGLLRLLWQSEVQVRAQLLL